MGEEGTPGEATQAHAGAVIRKLREAERLIGEGKTIPEAAKELGAASRPITAGATGTAG
jgi:hypothetical protein